MRNLSAENVRVANMTSSAGSSVPISSLQR